MKFTLTILSLLLYSLLSGQSISSYVITSAGEAIMSDEGALYLSVGEPMNTELHGGEVMISQGFLQVTIANRVLSSDQLLEETITVYPNPTLQELRFTLLESSENYGARIYNSGGEILHNVKALSSAKIDVSQYPAGTYFVTLHKDDKISETIQFVKL